MFPTSSLSFRLVKPVLSTKSSSICQILASINLNSYQKRNFTSQEVEIPIPFIKNHIAGKLWEGENSKKSKSVPILCVHGLGDSVSSFEPLLNLYASQNESIKAFAFDLPGNGKSYHVPSLTSDIHIESLYAILRVAKFLKWEKFNLVSHSFGGLLSLSFTATFQNYVNKLIGMDMLHPLFIKLTPNEEIDMLGDYLSKLMEIELKISNEKTVPPSYTREQMIERMYEGRMKLGGLSRKGCELLLERSSKGTPDNKLQFTHDPRYLYFFLQGKQTIAPNVKLYASRIKTPLCFIVNTPGIPWGEEREDIHTTLKLLRENSLRFEEHNIEGPHHNHLLHPHRILPIIRNFIET